MPLPSLRYSLPILFVLAALSSCSDASNGDAIVPEQSTPTINEADKLAARKLSIANTAALRGIGSPYEQAIACSIAIERIAERLQQTGMLSDQQAQAIGQARTYYDGRVRALGRGTGKSESDVRSDLRLQAESGSEPRELALRALDCLQRLGQPS